MPGADIKRALIERDGHHCRFCRIPVIRTEIRQRIHKLYPESLPWGRSNTEQHSAFQALWLQYDHILPHARGGESTLDNMVVTCAGCNYSRMEYTLEETGLSDPRMRPPIRSTWDGLERFV
jgi:5-methylcytosine-specific restriction endonuclease McrA